MTSPVYTGGMGVLQFNYVRGFTGTSARSFTVWVNGTQIGGVTTVNATVSTVAAYNTAINVGGNVSVEIRTSGAQIVIDDIQWNAYSPGPTVNFDAASSTALESAGTVAVNMTISPPATAAGSITVTINGTSTATYGAGNDYTTNPVGPTTITIPVVLNQATASFDVIVNDDAVINEGDETIDFSITAATGGTFVGSNSDHQFTITDNDIVPSVQFGTLNVTVLEGSAAQTFTINISTPHVPGSVTVSISNGAGVTYGVSPNDYTTSAGAGPFTIPFGSAATSVFFTAVSYNDGLAESTETVTFTITAVTGAGIIIGSNPSATFTIGDINSPPAIFAPGDLAMVGMNANDNGCDGGDPADYDYVSFFCFQEITYGTEIILTDNGYERCNTGQWGNTEGAVRMRRTGPAIPAGQVVTFKINGVSGSSNVVSVAPDAGWSCTSIGVAGTAIALNVNGEQLFFMQGTWVPGSTSNNNAGFTGTLLYAFSSNPTNPWSAFCGSPEGNKRSNLPPGVDCFSMAPTNASDYSKYIGPSTAATQRDWIIRIENPTNWSSYPDCATYSSSGYNWMTAPILPITPGAMVNGVWRGAINTDWFECKNWDDARIPDATTDVVINQNSTRSCLVGLAAPPGLNPGGTAVANSLLLVSNAASPVLMVEANSTLNVGHDVTVDRTAGSGVITLTVKANATLSGDNLILRSVNPLADEAVLSGGNLNAASRFSGDVTIEPGGFLNLFNTTPANFGTLYIGGDYTNQRTEAAFKETYSQVVFDGNGPQAINTNGFQEIFNSLQVNKPSGVLTLNAPIAVGTTLDLLSGQVLSTSLNLPTIKATGNVTSTSNASFVNGPVQKIGNTPFIFPVGNNNVYRPASLSGITGAGAAFTAEYINDSPTATLGPSGMDHDATLHHVSGCEHWRIDRSSGTPNAVVTLSWQDPVSCGVTNLPDMRVGYWTGTLWTDAGGTLITGTNAAGTVSTSGAQSTFLQPANYWTLASLSNANPLPIELLSFTAQPNGSRVDLKWSTASEMDNDHFTVERSADATDFTPLLQVPGAGNSQNVIDYADTDPSPLDGLSYYRLRQTDIDGTTVVSDAVPVYFSGSKGQPLQVLYGNDGLFLLHDFAPGSTLEVMDLTGRVVASTGITARGLVKVPLDGMAHGVYLLRMSNGGRMESTRVAY